MGVYLVQVWPSQHDFGPVSVCLRSRSSSPPLHICLAPPTTKGSTAIRNTCVLSFPHGAHKRTNTKHCYHDDSLLLVVLLSQSLGDNFDHNVGLQPVICSDRLLILLLLLLHLNKKHFQNTLHTQTHTLKTKSQSLYLDDLLQSRFLLLLRPGLWTWGRVFPLGGGRCCCFESTSAQGRTTGRHKQIQTKYLNYRISKQRPKDPCTSIWKDRLQMKRRPGWKQLQKNMWGWVERNAKKKNYSVCLKFNSFYLLTFFFFTLTFQLCENWSFLQSKKNILILIFI